VRSHILDLQPRRSFDGLSYVLLPTRFKPGFEGADRYMKAYGYWLEFWNRVYAENGTSDRADAADFQRVDIVGLVMKEEKIAAMLLHSIVNLENPVSSHHPYFAGDYGQRFFGALKDERMKTALTFEYLAVDREWRKSATGIPFSHVMFGLGFEIQKSAGLDVCIGRLRQDVKMPEAFQIRGGKIVIPDVMMHNTPTHFCATPLKDLNSSHPDPAIAELVRMLWIERRDMTREEAMLPFSTVG
jgi:hypothetical protein